MDLPAAMGAFLIQLQADGRSPHTLAQYGRHLRLLDRWLATEGRSRELDAIDPGTLARFLVDDVARQRPDGAAKKATSTNALRSSLRAFWAYTHAAGLVPVNPARLIRRARCAPPPPRALPDPDMARLLSAVDAGDSVAARRDAALVRLLAGTGIRLSSALGLRRADVDLDRGELRVRKTKGDAPITLPLGREVARGLRTYLRSVPDGYLFPGASDEPLTRRQAGRRIAEAAERAGLTGRASAHVMRHVFATRLLRTTGGNVALVQQALGHRTISSTMVYARAEAGELRAALRGLRTTSGQLR